MHGANIGFMNFWFIFIIIWLFVAIFVASDASKYGENGMLWGLVVMLMPMMGLLVYLVVRSNWSYSTRQVRTSPPAQNTYSSQASKRPLDLNTQQKASNPQSDQFCTNCGIRNHEGANYCRSCGTSLDI